jgi:hypothetical protein
MESLFAEIEDASKTFEMYVANREIELESQVIEYGFNEDSGDIDD